MTKEEEQRLREMIGNNPREQYTFEGDDITFIKEQNITVQSGANFYNGSQPKNKKSKEVADEEPQQGKTKCAKNVIDRITDGVCAVYDSNLINNDYEYAAIYKAIEEIKPFDKFSYKEFVELLNDSGRFKDGELPTSSNISKIIIKGNYPNWRVSDKGYLVTKQILKIGDTFFKAYNEE